MSTVKGKVAGLVRAHEGRDTLPLVLDRLAEHVDATFVLAHNPADGIVELARRGPKVRAVKVEQSPWRQQTTLQALFAMLSDFAPRVAVFPDEDEILPDHFGEELAHWSEIAEQEQRASMGLYYFHSWNEPQTIVADWPYRTNCHCKALLWRPDIDFSDYAGWCWPRAFYKQRKYRSPFALRHLAYMTPAMREVRLQRAEKTTRGEQRWWMCEHPTIPYDPGMTWSDYTEQSKAWTCSMWHTTRHQKLRKRRRV